MQLLIPATQSNEKFCSTLFSSLVNGYPASSLIDYNLSINDFQAGQDAKILGYKKHLDFHVKDEDVVIFVDGYDVAFQLSLDILMKRLKRANYQSHFAADKKCWPVVENNSAAHYCDKIPQSTLPLEIYGKFSQEWPNLPPRCLNSGTAIGMGKNMRDILQAAFDIAKQGTVGTNDQGVIAETFALGHQNFTLDYESQFFQTLIFSWHDMEWTVNPDPNTPPTWFIPLDPSKSRKLDLSDLALETPKGRKTSPWRNRRLARNIPSNTIPILLHHNLHTELIQKWFTYMWFGDLDMGTQLQTMLVEQSGKGGAGAWDGSRWVGYKDLCGHYDLFRGTTA